MLGKKTLEIDLSQYILAGIYKMITCLDEIELEKGACGRYNDKEKRENTHSLLFVTILTWKKAPAAAVTTNNNPCN